MYSIHKKYYHWNLFRLFLLSYKELCLFISGLMPLWKVVTPSFARSADTSSIVWWIDLGLLHSIYVYMHLFFGSVSPYLFSLHHFLLMSSLLIRSLSIFPVILLSIFISAVSSNICVLAVSGLISDVYVIIGLREAL